MDDADVKFRIAALQCATEIWVAVLESERPMDDGLSLEQMAFDLLEWLQNPAPAAASKVITSEARVVWIVEDIDWCILGVYDNEAAANEHKATEPRPAKFDCYSLPLLTEFKRDEN